MQEDKNDSLKISFPVGAVCFIKTVQVITLQSSYAGGRRRLKWPRTALDFTEPQLHYNASSILALILC